MKNKIIWAAAVILLLGVAVYAAPRIYYYHRPAQPATWDDVLASLPAEWDLLAAAGWRIEVCGERPPHPHYPGKYVVAWCDTGARIIVLFTPAPQIMADRENTIRHEVAHALHAMTDPRGFWLAGYEDREMVAELWATGTAMPGASSTNVSARVEIPPQMIVDPKSGIRYQP